MIFSGNTLFIMQNLDKLGVQNIDLQEFAYYYSKENEDSYSRKFLIKEPFFITIARFSSAKIIKEALDKFINDLKKDIAANNGQISTEINHKHFLNDRTSNFSHFIGSLFEQDTDVIKEVVNHIKTYETDFFHQCLFEQNIKEDKRDLSYHSYLSEASLAWVDNKDKHYEEKLNLYFDLLEVFFNKNEMPINFMYHKIKDNDVFNAFIKIIVNRKYELSIEATKSLIENQENEVFNLSTQENIQKALKSITESTFLIYETYFDDTKENQKYLTYINQLNQKYNVYEQCKSDELNQNLVFYFAFAYLDSRSTLDKKYLDDINQFLGKISKTKKINEKVLLVGKNKEMLERFESNGIEMKIENMLTHFTNLIGIKNQKFLIDQLENYPFMTQKFKNILTEHYAQVILEQLYESEPEHLIIGSVDDEEKFKRNLRLSREFVKAILLKSLDLVSYIEEEIKSDNKLRNKFEKIVNTLEKDLLEKNTTQAKVSKKIKL